MLTEPSPEFIDSFCDSGSIAVTCDLCGTTIFASLREGWFDPGELEELREKAKKKSEKYQEYPAFDSISFGKIEGKTVVPGHSKTCDEKIAKYEQWITNHRFIIAKYLNKRIERINRDAKLEEDMTKVAPQTDYQEE